MLSHYQRARGVQNIQLSSYLLHTTILECYSVLSRINNIKQIYWQGIWISFLIILVIIWQNCWHSKMGPFSIKLIHIIQ